MSGDAPTGAGEDDWFLLAPVTFVGPRGPVELCAFVSASDHTTVVV